MDIYFEKIFYSFVFFVFFIKKSFEQTNTNNIVFDLADLTIDYQNDFNRVRIEAFKSINNDLIIEKKETEKYGELMWLSIGDPTLTLSSIQNASNISSLFIFKQGGFDVFVKTLTNNHKKMFKDVVMRKYNISIKEDQIVSLVPSKFECQIILHSGNTKMLINGRGVQLNRMPLKISFDAPVSSKERLLFETIINSEKNNIDFPIYCEATSSGQTYRENTLVISGTQLNRLGLTDKIFGLGNEKYVTRNQVSQLSSEIYQKLNIIEQYQMPENKFKESFINDFISVTATSTFKNVKVNETLSLLSRYNFDVDLKPNIIYSEMSKIFSINKTQNKDILTLNKTNYDKLIQTYSVTTGGSAGGSFFGISFGGSASYTSQQSKYWESSNTLFTDQLNELNTYSENEVEWERKGNIIVPKSISVSKLSKALFQREMTFSRIKREFTVASYKRSFLLEITHALNHTNVDNTKKLVEFEKKIKNHFENIKNIKMINIDSNELISRLKSTEVEYHKLKAELNKHNEIVNEIYKFLKSINYQNFLTKDKLKVIGVLQNGNIVSLSLNAYLSFDRVVIIWNPNDGSLIRSFRMWNSENFKSVSQSTVLQNGNIVIGYDRSFQMLNSNDGSLIRNVNDLSADCRIYSYAILQNGNFATGGWKCGIKIWNQNDGSLIRTLPGHSYQDRVDAFTILQNGNLVSAATREISIWNQNDGSLIKTLDVSDYFVVGALTVLKNGNLVSGEYDRQMSHLVIKIRNKNDWSTVNIFKQPYGVQSFAVLQNGNLVSGNGDGTIKIRNPNDGSLIRTLTGHKSIIRYLTILQNGNLVSSDDGGVVKIWSLH